MLIRMTANPQSQRATPDPIMQALFASMPLEVNADLSVRTQMHAKDAHWQSTTLPGLSLCVLELHHGLHPRMSALMRIEPSADGVVIPAHNLELLVQHGLVADSESEYCHPFYLRHPEDASGYNQHFTLHSGGNKKRLDNTQLEFYFATGQLAATDTQRRCINLAESSLWLPGPVDKTEVMPLHMHNGNNSMLIRWLGDVSFKPRLDPLGEEVLVIDGTVSDKFGDYTAGSWIRNPVSSWQSWSGLSGTVVYYKNGHFGSSA